MTRVAEAFEATLQRLGISEGDLDAESFGRRAALLAAAELLWERELGPSLSAKDLMEVFHCSRQAISDRVKRGRLLALPASGGGYEFPAFQFASDGQPLEGLPDVLETLLPAVESPYTVASWLVAAEPELESEQPITLLRRGEIEPVQIAARHFAARLRR